MPAQHDAMTHDTRSEGHAAACEQKEVDGQLPTLLGSRQAKQPFADQQAEATETHSCEVTALSAVADADECTDWAAAAEQAAAAGYGVSCFLVRQVVNFASFSWPYIKEGSQLLWTACVACSESSLEVLCAVPPESVADPSSPVAPLAAAVALPPPVTPSLRDSDWSPIRAPGPSVTALDLGHLSAADFQSTLTERNGVHRSKPHPHWAVQVLPESRQPSGHMSLLPAHGATLLALRRLPEDRIIRGDQ